MKRFKFYLKPGQQSPVPGSTGVVMPDGGIVFEGDVWPDEKIEAHEFTAEDEKEWIQLQDFMTIVPITQITFGQFKDPVALATKIAADKVLLDAAKTKSDASKDKIK